MKDYVNGDKLQEFAEKLHAKQKTIFAMKSEVGSPLVAATVADMTELDRIYVYVGSESGYTAGNWYYYNGSAWTSGGVYNSTAFETDDTLAVPGAAADAKAVGDALTEIEATIPEVDDTLSNTGKAADAKKTGDEISGLKSDFTVEIPIERCFLNAQRSYSDGAYVARNDRCVSIKFTLPSNVYIKATEYTVASIIFNSDNPNDYTFSGYKKELMIPANKPFMYIINSGDGNFTADMADDIHLYSSEGCKIYFDNNYYHHLTDSRKAWSEDGNDNIVERGSVFASQDLNGFRLESEYFDYCWRTVKPIICDKPVMLMCADYTDMRIALRYVNTGEFINIYGNTIYTVPANTAFCFTIWSSNTDITNTLGNHAFLLISGSALSVVSESRIMRAYTQRTDCAFMADGKDFLIDRQNKTYTVCQGHTILVDEAALDGEVAHANSCNYINGKVYISGWTDSNIYVYDVDTENNTLTYDKTITLPVGGDTYVCASDERQILVLRWGTTYNQSTNYEENYLRLIGLYYQDGEYKIGWEKALPAIYELQGMCYQDGCLYVVDNAIPYKHRCIIRIDCGSGIMTESADYFTTTALKSLESEAIYPVNKNLFKIVTVDGQIWLCSFIPKY